jgi:23S rRNA (cytidine1920-2'-O)/16S rRNA (cytidine1409-2'-O)-methyltransferase
MTKQRLDNLLVNQELTGTMKKAQALIMAGEVIVNGKVVTKPGTMVDESASIILKEQPQYASRGGIKLAHALNEFKIDVSSLTVLDIGASTGGFTDCLLQHGAGKIYAVDVGYGQIDFKLRQDPRVIIMDRTNARYPFQMPGKADMATIDLSFISVTKIIPNIIAYLKPASDIIVLLKPQFEAERNEIGKGGIIKDPVIHTLVIARFVKWMVENKLRFRGLTTSPVLGAEGNREFLVLIRTDS